MQPALGRQTQKGRGHHLPQQGGGGRVPRVQQKKGHAVGAVAHLQGQAFHGGGPQPAPAVQQPVQKQHPGTFHQPGQLGQVGRGGLPAGQHLLALLQQGGAELLGVQRFEEVALHPVADGLLGVGELLVPAQDQEAGGQVLLPGPADHLQPVQFGHVDVQDRNVRLVPVQNVHRLGAGGGAADHQRLFQHPLHQGFQPAADAPLVVCDQDGDLLVHALPPFVSIYILFTSFPYRWGPPAPDPSAMIP